MSVKQKIIKIVNRQDLVYGLQNNQQVLNNTPPLFQEGRGIKKKHDKLKFLQFKGCKTTESDSKFY